MNQKPQNVELVSCDHARPLIYIDKICVGKELFDDYELLKYSTIGYLSPLSKTTNSGAIDVSPNKVTHVRPTTTVPITERDLINLKDQVLEYGHICTNQ